VQTQRLPGRDLNVDPEPSIRCIGLASHDHSPDATVRVCRQHRATAVPQDETPGKTPFPPRRRAKKPSKKKPQQCCGSNTHTALGALMRIVILQTPVGKYNQGFRMMVAIGRTYAASFRSARRE
jgi:hypothetical protein